MIFLAKTITAYSSRRRCRICCRVDVQGHSTVYSLEICDSRMLWMDCLSIVHTINVHAYQHETKQEVDALKKSRFGYQIRRRAYPPDIKYARGSLKASPVERHILPLNFQRAFHYTGIYKIFYSLKTS